MESLFSNDPIDIIAFRLGVAVSAMTVFMLFVIIIMRQVVLRRERIHANAVAFWENYIISAPDHVGGAIPELLDRDVDGFLEVWNRVHEPLHGATTPHLARVARESGLEKHLHKRLNKSGFHSQLLVIIGMGHVQNKENFHLIEQFILDENPIVSLCAARALMQIDSTRAVSKFVPQIASRGDWPQGSIATILHEGSTETLSRELSQATIQANAEIAPRLIRFLADVSPQSAAPIIRETILASLDDKLVSTCLQVMSNSDDLDCVRPLLAHSRWHVRMQAAVTLGRLGVPGDEEHLSALLSDEQWWVRYRAAQALLKLSFIDNDDMDRIQLTQKDGYARDIIDHVMAEKAMGLAA